MPTITEQLTELINQKNNLADNLNTMGVQASESETLNTLVPKVLDINTGDDNDGEFLIQVVDPYGNVLKMAYLDTGEIFELPNAPQLDKLVFQGWASPIDIIDNCIVVEDCDVTIGGIYTTLSGDTELDITLTDITGLDISISCFGEIDWGDGNINITTSSPSKHTYTNLGCYTIKIKGLTSIPYSYFMTQSSSNENYSLTEIRLPTSITSIASFAFQKCRSLKNVILSNGLTNINGYAFSECYSLMSINFPNSVVTIGASVCDSCYSLINVTLANNITSIGSGVFTQCYSLTSLTIPKSVTTFYTSFKGNYSLKRLVIPNSIASGLLLSSEAFYNCYSLKEIKLPNVDLLTTVGNGSFGYCYSLKKIIIPSNVTAIASRAFYYCRGIIEYDFSQCTSIPTLSSTDAFYEINPICKIKVPSALYETWITSVRWSTFADYIEAV